MQNYDEFCERCKNYNFTFEKGILCRLTDKKPDFTNSCKNFNLDSERDEKIRRKKRFKQQNDSDISDGVFRTMMYLIDDLTS